MNRPDDTANDRNAEEALSPIKRALIEVRELRRRLAAYEAERSEPIAIIGMACRLPQSVEDADGFWQLLREGRNAVSEIPPSRWDIERYYDADADAPGKMYTRGGAFVAGADQFDPYFFGIPPREAAGMDPQQRLLLEVSWEALENAGLDASSLAGSATGVFIGIGASDYALLQARGAPLERIDAYFSSGVAHSVAAGRLSYFFGFHGPAVAVDTACSSSLVAVHSACQSLRVGECRLALVGGASLALAPDLSVNFCRARMLSPTDACHTFDAAADGYVRGEGVVVIALKRLADATADGDRILAVIRGSAVNQDGRSTGLTVPNGPAQEAVIRQALKSAGVAPHEVGYVEAHGTGTPLGDPIEVQALAAALGEGRAPDVPLLIGSVKTNIGHLEASAGIAGLMKVVLALQHGEIPAHLHFQTPSPHIDWRKLPVEVTAQPRAWPTGKRTAGVSSFGFSGTNAHVILQQAPVAAAVETQATQQRPQHLLALSAKDPAALRALAARYSAHIEAHPEQELADICHTAAAGRAHHSHRVAIVAADRAAVIHELARFTADATDPPIHTAVSSTQPEIGFLFTGQGSQYVGMGRELYASEPVFRAVLDRCAAALAGQLPRPLLEVMFEDTGGLLDQTLYTQPALYALEVGLAALWQSWGVKPAIVLGHSVGEYAAACVAGVFSVEDGARLIGARARLMQALPPGGGMLAVQGDDLGAVDSILAAHVQQVSVAARNAPDSMVISGASAALDAIAPRLQQLGLTTQPLLVSHAFHSPLMTPMLEEFARIAQSLQPREPQVDWVSNLSGELFDWTAWSGRMGEYWRRHVREPVRFQQGIETAGAQGVRVFLEIGPHPVLSALGRATLDTQQASWLPSLRRGREAWPQMLETVAQLYVRGAPIAWAAVDAPYARRKVALPTYPFQRQRYWIDVEQATGQRQPDSVSLWDRALAAGLRQAGYAPYDLAIETFPAKWRSLEDLSRSYMIDALRGLGLFTTAGERRGAADAVAAARVLPVYGKLMDRWLSLLAQAGVLERDGATFVARTPLPQSQSAALLQVARERFSNYPAMLDYVELCGTKLIDVLTGRESPLETLFPGGSGHIAEGLYQTSVVARYYNEIVRSIVQAVAGRGGLSILEIGAGTGGTTSVLLPSLSAAGTRYVFTDVSKLFLVQASRKFADYPFVEYALLDVERPPREQGFAEHTYDLIVAANVLHATPDLEATLRHARSLLASGGVLVMLETTQHPHWLDVSTGLIEGWQKFEDPLRATHPLLDSGQWATLLRECGFDGSEAFPPAGSPLQQLGQHVIVARAPQFAADPAAANSVARAVRAPGSLAVESTREAAEQLHERIAAATDSGRLEILEDVVREEICQVLGIDRAHQPAPTQRLKEFGVDSLMAVELRNKLAKRLALRRKLTATLIFDYPTVQAIARHLAEDMLGFGAQPQAAAAPQVAETAALSARVIEQMDDAEAEAALLERLKSL